MENFEFIVDSNYKGYVFLGWAFGRFTTEQGEVKDYANIYTLSPVSDFVSDDYQASGFKAEKHKCESVNVWKDLNLVPGDRVRLLFDDKKRVVMILRND